MLLWGNLNYNFNQAAMAYSSNDLNGAFALNRGWLNNHLIAYMESHDEERLMYSCLLYTSDAADERSSVDLGGSRIIKKKKKKREQGVHER